MSQENVELIRRSYAAFNSGNWDSALEAAHPEIEWRLHGDLGIDVPQLIRGREEVRALWADFFEVWDDYRMDLLDLGEPREGTVLATVRFSAHGQGSNIPIELTYFWVHVVRDGSIASVDAYTDRDQAQAAAGTPLD